MFTRISLLESCGLLGRPTLHEKFLNPDQTENNSRKIIKKSIRFGKTSPPPLAKSEKLLNSIAYSEATQKTQQPDAVRQNDLSSTETDRQLAVTSVSTVLTGAGKLFFPRLVPFGIAGILYSLKDSGKRAYKSLTAEGKITFDALEILLDLGLISAGYYFTGCVDYFVYLLSMKLLNRVEDKSRQNVVGFFENQPGSVWIVKEGIEIKIPFDSLQTGDIAAVRAGESVPADGIITEGAASVDQHILTGESVPAEKAAGDSVFASTFVLSGRILFRVEKSGKETVVANIADILNRTVDYKTGIQSKGEKIAQQWVMPTMALSAVALPIAGATGALGVLSSYIGSDVRIFVPLSTLNFLRAASENGIVIKDGRALELLSKTDTVVFDKTGTLTTDRLSVRKIHTCEGYDEKEILRYAAIAEKGQTHPVAAAILDKARAYGGDFSFGPDNADDAACEVGYGVRVKVSEAVIYVGSERFMRMQHIEIPQKISDLTGGGSSFVMVAKDNLLIGAMELRTTVRPEVKNIINCLKKRNKSLYIITGDHEIPAKALAEELGIENYFSETLPEQKAQLIEQLQKAGGSVCFVGDGINDSIAMKKAHVSVSLRGASTVATDTANIILMDGTLRGLDKLFELSEDFDKNMNTALKLAVVPGLINIGAVFLLHTGIYVAAGLYYLCLPLNLGNSFLPMIQYKKKS